VTVTTHGVALHGIDGILVEVEIGLQDGLAGIDITGLPAASVKEARHRVRSALRAGGYEWPPDRLVVNFAPADLPKHGTAFDLPLAVAVLVLFGVLSPEVVKGTVFFGELALDGSLRPVPGAVNAAIAARSGGRRALVVAPEVASEAAALDGLEVIAARSLVELVEHLLGRMPITATQATTISEPRRSRVVDLASIRGQIQARRALELAAAGRHNVLFIGPPGCGKTLLARALPGILPPLTLDEALEVTRIHSISGLTGRGIGLVHTPPFRAPHPTASEAALVGGGSPPMPGEVSLAHRGVLFLDEAAEFRRSSLDALRAPIEDRQVTVARARRSVAFPSAVMLILATNPCPCGHLGDPRHACRCTPAQVRAYQQRLSGPLLDRIDLHVELRPVATDALAGDTQATTSAEVQARVIAARALQYARNATPRAMGGPSGLLPEASRSEPRSVRRGEHDAVPNADLDIEALNRVAHLGSDESRFLARAGDALGISARAWHRVLRVARTAADLAGAERVTTTHLAEALAFRRALAGAADKTGSGLGA